MMDTTRYQKFVNKTAFFPRSTQGRNISYLVMGIVEEVGEIYEFILKKQKLKEGDNYLNEYVASQIVKELGDLVLLSNRILNEENTVTLDDMNLEQISNALNVSVKVVGDSPADFFSVLQI